MVCVSNFSTTSSNGDFDTKMKINCFSRWNTNSSSSSLSSSSSSSTSTSWTSQPIPFYLILCSLAFLLSTPQNMMSPSLTEIANDLGFTERSRDLYIGSYMQLSYSVISLPFSLIGGILTDHLNRVWLCAIVVILGGLSMIGFGLIQSYEILLFLRMIQGIAFGAIVPIIYSLMSDLFYPCKRARMSAYMTVFLGAGTLLGQLFAGYMAPLVGWHFPFVFFGGITLLEGMMLLQILREPVRGGMDIDPDIHEAQLREDPAASSLLPSSSSSHSSSTESPHSSHTTPPLCSKTTLNSTIHMFMIPSVFLMFIQAIPNKYSIGHHTLSYPILSIFLSCYSSLSFFLCRSIPWGLLSVHMHDFLVNESQLDISTATSLIAIFGAGAAIGGIGGGILGTHLYSISKWYLPLFMGSTLIVAAIVMQFVLILCVHPTKAIVLTSLIIGLAGGLASVNGSLSRAVLLNVSTPFTRGLSVSCLTILNSLGRGIGPSIMTFLMNWQDLNRKLAMEYLLYFWIISGLLLAAIGIFIHRDEDMMRNETKKQEKESEVMLIGGGKGSKRIV